MELEILRLTAFPDGPNGGNPAGVVLLDHSTEISDQQMQEIAEDVGYSETAFLKPLADGTFNIRYFSPLSEQPFCGHATIATACAYAERHEVGELLFRTEEAGDIPVLTSKESDGTVTATFTSPKTSSDPIDDEDLKKLLDLLGWSPNDLDLSLRPHTARAGSRHAVIAAADLERLKRPLDYDMEALNELMEDRWATITLVHRDPLSEDKYWVRNPFPPGGVKEDPATGAAAAAFTGYLRDQKLIEVPGNGSREITIHQGHFMEPEPRPSKIVATVFPESGSGIEITGTTIPISVEPASSPTKHPYPQLPAVHRRLPSAPSAAKPVKGQP